MTFVWLSLWNEIATREGTHMLDDLNNNNILFATGLKVDNFDVISNAKRVQIKQFVSMPNVQHYRILGRIEKIYEEHLWIYKCKTCFREVENQYDWIFCSQCGEDVETTTTFFNIKMVIKDCTGSMELLVKHTKAEFILRCVPSDLKKLMLKENGVQILKEYLSQFYGHTYVFIIPAPQPMNHEHCVSVVTFVLKVDWSEECLHISKGISRTGKEPMRSS
ncbi:hypothetical protein RHMOL_Rhmol12G0137700 [Rhododendron molle]|uniref:Uncharacterized protein n=1 Tax=Rhododendron molle TaxID=49168 RepID=A0ACC0LHT5_RHOML|nr:hypothetical protein RHMOL_Rhmol12G0137700 [Rhododendron molle]